MASKTAGQTLSAAAAVIVPADLGDRLASKVINLDGPRQFATGSKGFHGQDKITTADGSRWQASILVVLIGSKADPESKCDATADAMAIALSPMVQAEAQAKTFSSGKVGVHAQGKITVAGQRYQWSAQAVHIAPSA